MNVPTSLSLCLEPISHPDLGEIIVDGCLFAVGRMEAPFTEHPNDAVGKLSRRHARIFQEAGRFYLTDLASRNGTTCNGKQTTHKPVPLNDADEIGFADIRYRVHIRVRQPAPELDAETGTELLQPLRLTLVPLEMPGCDPIEISGFPFLVSKSAGVFSQHREMFKDSLAFISRRHAHLYLVNDAIFIEDLNSTNGTFVNGERQEEHARQLQDGDTLAFGNPDCCFRVEIMPPTLILDPVVETDITTATEALLAVEEATAVTEVTEALAPESAEIDRSAGAESAPPQQPSSKDIEFEQGTILVDKASPFLDIFYDRDGEESAEVEPEPPQQGDGRDDNGRADSVIRRRMRKVGLFWSELTGALMDEPGNRPRIRWVLVVLVLVLGSGLLIYQRGAPERQVNALVEQGDYAAGAALAARYLAQQPDHEALRKLVNSAIIKHLIPSWQQQLEGRDFDQAAALIAQARSVAQGHAEVGALMDLVAWMTTLERFVLRQDGENALVIYRDETTLNALIDQWQADATGNRLRLGMILREVAGFKSTHTKVMSHLRLLQSYKTVYLKASEALKREVDDHLSRQQLPPLRARITSFQQKYPKVGGTQLLLADLDDYLSLQHELDQRRLVPLIRQWRQVALRTPPFQRLAAERIGSVLPPEAVANRYFDSEAAWQDGDAQQAIAILEPLTDLPWGDVAKATIERYQAIHQGYEALTGAKPSPEAQEQLLRFYRQLQGDTDVYYQQALQPAFREAGAQVLKRAEAHFLEAEKHWLAYRSAGGISGLLRLEETVSNAFRQRATELVKAQQYLTQGSGNYQLLARDYPPRWATLRHNVLAELKRQRNWLIDLEKVLPEKLVKGKLKLLPLPEADSRVSG